MTRSAFITGAAGGIGRATALELARTHTVVLCDIDKARLDETAQFVAEAGGTAHIVAADVTDLAAMQEAVAAAHSLVGPLHDAVATAGIEVTGTIAELSAHDWARSLAVNLTGTFTTAKAFIEDLRLNEGTFTAIASDAGTTGAQGYSAYAAAKHGVVGLIRCMALDFGPEGVRSNVICPGFVETPMARRLFADTGPEEEEFYRRSIPLGRFASPEDVAATVRHLIDSGYANGTVYALDGGSTAGYFPATT